MGIGFEALHEFADPGVAYAQKSGDAEFFPGPIGGSEPGFGFGPSDTRAGTGWDGCFEGVGRKRQGGATSGEPPLPDELLDDADSMPLRQGRGSMLRAARAMARLRRREASALGVWLRGFLISVRDGDVRRITLSVDVTRR